MSPRSIGTGAGVGAGKFARSEESSSPITAGKPKRRDGGSSGRWPKEMSPRSIGSGVGAGKFAMIESMAPCSWGLNSKRRPIGAAETVIATARITSVENFMSTGTVLV